jgi:hypothetical protein
MSLEALGTFLNLNAFTERRRMLKYIINLHIASVMLYCFRSTPVTEVLPVRHSQPLSPTERVR